MSRKLISIAEFKKREGKLKEDEVLRGMVIPEVKQIEDGEDGIELEFIVSNASVDRDRDTIAVDGWDVSDFTKNPVVLWAHQYGTPPIAKATETKVADGALRSRAKFTPPDLSEFGHMIGRMYKEGFMNAVSVGFLPDEWSFDEDRRGVNFLKQAMLEFSAVPVPSNPEALIQARSAGIDTAPLVEWAEKVLDNDGGTRILLPRKAVEEMREAAKGGKAIIQLNVWTDGDTSAIDDDDASDKNVGGEPEKKDPTPEEQIKELEDKVDLMDDMVVALVSDNKSVLSDLPDDKKKSFSETFSIPDDWMNEPKKDFSKEAFEEFLKSISDDLKAAGLEVSVKEVEEGGDDGDDIVLTLEDEKGEDEPKTKQPASTDGDDEDLIVLEDVDTKEELAATIKSALGEAEDDAIARHKGRLD